jgi:hypothetical protein
MPRKLRIGYSRPYRMPADRGTYTLSGQAAAVRRAGRLDAAQGSYSVTGQDATLDHDQTLTTLTTLTLSSSGVSAKPFTVGYVFAQGDVTGSITASVTPFQADVRNRWSDGSVRFAVLSGLSAPGVVTLYAGGAPYSASNVAEPSTTAVVAFTSVVDASGTSIGGGSFSASLATARANGSQAWSRTTAHKVREILGPVMSEFHYFCPTTDAHTHVWFYVRAYSTGDVEVETKVENGWFQVASPGRRNYNVTVTVNGILRYTGTGLAHYHHTHWSRVDWAGTDPQVVPKHNTTYLQTTGLFPKTAVSALSSYTTKPENGTKYSAWTKALAEQPTPFSLANIDPAMGSGGISDNVNLFAPWEMTYVVEGNAGAYWSMQGNARASGYFCTHYRDENTGAPVRGSQHLTKGIHNTSAGITNVAGNASTSTPAPTGGAPSTTFYPTHAPSVAFGAYLTSGRWSSMEELQFIASVSDLESNDGWAYNSYKIVRGSVSLRHWAWMVRFAAQSAICSPEYLMGSAVSGVVANSRTEATGRFAATMAFYKASYVDGTTISAPNNWQYRSFAGNALGLLWTPDYTNGLTTTQLWLGGMLQTYGVTCVMWAYTTGALDSTDLSAFAAQCSKWPIGMLGAESGSTLWDWRCHTGYAFDWGTVTRDGSNDVNSITPRTSWDAQWTAINTYTWATQPSALPSNNSLYRLGDMQAGGTIPMTQLTNLKSPSEYSEVVAFSSAIAMAHQVAQRTTVTGNADIAAQRYYGSTTWTSSVTGVFPSDANYAVMSKEYAVPYSLPASGEAVAISSNTPLDIKPSDWSGGNWVYSLFESFGAGVYAPGYSSHGAYVLAGTGGHGHPDHIGAAVFNFSTGAWERLDVANSGTFKTAGAVYTTSDSNGDPTYEVTGTQVPLPPHPYQHLCYDPTGAKGSVIYVTRAAAGALAVISGHAHRFDLSTRLWSRATSSPISPTTRAREESSAIWDEDRNRWWLVSSDNFHIFSNQAYLDRSDMTWKTLGTFSTPPGSAAVPSRLMMHDSFVIRNEGSGGALRLFDPDTPNSGWIALTVSGTLPARNACWARHSNGNWYAFEGAAASSTITRIVPPASPKTGTWTVSTITVTGATLPARSMSVGTVAHYNRFFYVPAVDCLCWIPGGISAAVYLIKPAS